MNDAPEPDLIGTAEAAQLLGLHRTTLTRRVEAGWLVPVFRTPGYRGDFFFDRAQVLAKRAAPGPSGAAPPKGD